MRQFRKMFLRCGLAIWLFVFAMTADVIVKAVVSGGFDANNPIVQIEHKCAGNRGAVSQASSIVPNPLSIVIIQPEPIAVVSTREHPSLPLQISSSCTSSSGQTPLRC